MGGINSKTFNEMVDEDAEDEGVGTPQKSHRIVDQWQDPRSPTVDITRTPIQVEKTPDKVIDPRSPTSGITRTPIQSYIVQPSDTPLNTHADVNSAENSHTEDPSETTPDDPQSEFARLNLDDSSDLDPKPECDQPEGEALIELRHNLPESESTAEDTEINNKKAGVDVLGFLEDIGFIGPFSPDVDGADSGNFVKTFSPSKSTNAKVVFRCHTNQNPSNQTEGKKTGRSPLKVIDSSSPRSQVKYDTNSPRAIVQRKQASKLGMLQNPARRKFNLGSPTKYNQLKEHDKEN